jgi:hypothetical protein
MSRAKLKNQLTQLHSPDDLEPTLLFAETFDGENGGLLAKVSLDAELMVGALDGVRSAEGSVPGELRVGALDGVKSAEGSVPGELMVGALDGIKSADGSVPGELMVGDRDGTVVSLVVGESVEGLV